MMSDKHLKKQNTLKLSSTYVFILNSSCRPFKWAGLAWSLLFNAAFHSQIKSQGSLVIKYRKQSCARPLHPIWEPCRQTTGPDPNVGKSLSESPDCVQTHSQLKLFLFSRVGVGVVCVCEMLCEMQSPACIKLLPQSVLCAWRTSVGAHKGGSVLATSGSFLGVSPSSSSPGIHYLVEPVDARQPF